MNDPHVERLRYRLETDSADVVWRDPPPLAIDGPGYTILLENGRLIVEMLDHYPNADSARLGVEPFLHAWEVHAAVSTSNAIEPLGFEFERAEVIDRSPDPPGVVRLSGTMGGSGSASVSLAIGFSRYPPPPGQFVVSADVESMWVRWLGYRAKRESLPSMAYFCLTVVEASVGGERKGQRRRAATELNVDLAVLNALGVLASEAGAVETRRKAHAKHHRPYTLGEEGWMIAAVKRLIGRVGEKASDPEHRPEPLTLADLPPLPPWVLEELGRRKKPSR
ncbi:MAG: hypothetical protein H0U10_08130 [Chloroflexia bacterium]|nr:hypothetical protein [Chloroflexia bacterium]